MKMNYSFIKILMLSFLILHVFNVNIEATGAESITITVTIKELISEVIVIAPDNQSGNPGQTLIYLFIAKNNGNVQDSYDLEAISSHNWKTDLPGGNIIGPLSAGEQEELDVSIAIPKVALANEEDILTLEMTSLSDSSVTGSGNVITTVNQIAAVTIRTPGNKRSSAGQVVNLRVRIINRGNGDDYFKLTALSSLGWGVNFPQGDTIGPIKPGKRETISTTVIVPEDAIRGDRDTVTVTATSQSDPSVSTHDSTTIIVR